MSGVYRFYETHGMPLDEIFDLFRAKNIMIDWIDFYKDARKAGMQHSRIIAKLEEALYDSFGKEFGAVVISRLNEIFEPKVEDLNNFTYFGWMK